MIERSRDDTYTTKRQKNDDNIGDHIRPRRCHQHSIDVDALAGDVASAVRRPIYREGITLKDRGK